MDHSDNSQTTHALLTEHFQYTPLSLIDDIIDSVNNYIYQGVTSLETGLFSTPPERLGFSRSLPASTQPTADEADADANNDEPFPAAKTELEEGLHSLETLLNSTVDKNFDKFEIYVLRNILAIPPDLAPYIRLKHHEGITYPPPSTSPVPTAEHLDQLRRKLHASRTLSRHLTTEVDRNEAILAQLRAMLDSPSSSSSSSSAATAAAGMSTPTPNLAFLPTTTNQQHQTRPLTTTTTFALTQLPALKLALADLRSRVDTLATAPATLDTARDERREERRGYIETRTRGFLARNGVDVAGPDAGAGSALSGRPVKAEELLALETVAGAFNPP